MNQHFPRHIHSIIPPHILSSIAERGSSEQRLRALRALAFDQSVRAARASNPGLMRLIPNQQCEDTPGTTPTPHRSIYDAQQSTDLPGKLVRGEQQPANKDVAVNEAYDGLGWTFNLFQKCYNRNSIDNKGLPLNASVHYSKQYDNAFWDGERMVFGDGDKDQFNRFTIAIEVIGHELTHGVTDNEANLNYEGQPGALNESISDVFGSLVKQFSLQQTADQADWLIGKGLFTSKVHGKALRSMKAPGTAYDDPILGKDPQPATMDGYVDSEDDNGGVHINSGIPNHAFYLAATAIGGFAWEKAGRVWYETLRDSSLKPTSKFSDFANLTVKQAEKLYGTNSPEQQAIQKAWETVKVFKAKVTHPPTRMPIETSSVPETTPEETQEEHPHESDAAD
ncbi:M4 family metallopeptidase [Ktedonospora formicarum]|uniref:Neutral metalloproteinase n=1 Tax=Ktedonospora formicarum TaxID=2778364 RepID=A0A8J3IAV2_9CHLR|nr:M4 family metallopeptidase [Ktedonospora formicarum]GHO47934.1 zinc metalloprotease [Ktedonospora formicarum]